MEESDCGDGRDSGASRGKVARLLDRYDLDDLGDELVARWTASDEERMSVRELADLLNRRLLEQRLAEADAHPLEGEVANLYRLLREEDVGGAERTRARRRLERRGVDVAALGSDFVSRQAVYTYLTSDRDASYDAGSELDPAAAVTAIGRLTSRLQAMVADRVERLHTNGELAIEDPQIIVDVRVYCEGCGAEVTVGELADGPSCRC